MRIYNYRDENKYIFFNELLYSTSRSIYGSDIMRSEILVKTERKFRKRIAKIASNKSKSYYKTSKVKLTL